MMLSDPYRTTLGADPAHRTCALNGYAFQQDALRTFKGWQYACFYSSPANGTSSAYPSEEPVYVHLLRRKLPAGNWETLVFADYAQTTDDGHNTVQLGICPGDGTIHLSYDHHCDVLRYRHSRVGVASSPETTPWDPSLFTPTLSALPGLETDEHVNELLSYITYPRFVTRGSDLLFTFRTGKAGLGDDHLCVYTASSPPSSPSPASSSLGREKGRYKFLGTHLKGVANNPYIHGLDAAGPDGRFLHMTWVYREFVHYPGWDDPNDTKHKQQAGPNSAANNRDICYAWSSDGGTRWHSGGGNNADTSKCGEVIADLGKGESIVPSSPGIVAFTVPKGSGLINQEAQAVDCEGGVHVLNRDNLEASVMRWKHYYRSPQGTWTQRALPYVEGVYGGKRGQVAVSRDGDLYFVLPHHTDPMLTILRASKTSRYENYELVWQGGGIPPTEPLVDKVRLGQDNVLSIFTRMVSESRDSVDVVVIDFQL
ncbi:hypothetical protein F5Y08DRAFT_18507 [Xylaria arbuscula]|nr:hypothetical protein F5Y08DRAFT_18507 [Xylaria arbuscula]